MTRDAAERIAHAVCIGGDRHGEIVRALLAAFPEASCACGKPWLAMGFHSPERCGVRNVGAIDPLNTGTPIPGWAVRASETIADFTSRPESLLDQVARLLVSTRRKALEEAKKALDGCVISCCEGHQGLIAREFVQRWSAAVDALREREPAK